MIMRYNVPETIGMKVDVYRNLHNGLWSIKAVNGFYKGKVIAHADELTLSEVVFKVNEKGRQRVNDRKRKEVHAVVRGILIKDIKDIEPIIDVYYDPYKVSFFQDRLTGDYLTGEYENVKFNRDKTVTIIK